MLCFWYATLFFVTMIVKDVGYDQVLNFSVTFSDQNFWPEFFVTMILYDQVLNFSVTFSDQNFW